MRKLIISISVLLVSLVLFSVFSCDESIEITDNIDEKACNADLKNNEEYIFEAKSHFETEVQYSESITSTKKGNKKSIRKLLMKSLLWDEAYVKQLTFGAGIVIPISYETELYVPKGDDHLYLSMLSYVLMYLDESYIWQTEVVTTLPDEIYMYSTNEDQLFSGAVVVEDWHGNFIKGYLYQGDILTSLILEDSRAKVESETCIVTEYWSDYYNYSGDYLYSELDYVEETCVSDGGGEVDNPDYPPGGGGSTGIPGEDSSDDGEEPDNELDENATSLNRWDLIRLNDIKNNLLKGYCPNQQMFNDIWSEINFQMNSRIESNAIFNPLTNTITFRNYNSINNATVLQEVFHSLQNNFYSGGTNQYVNLPGELNIEFEAWLYTEVWLFVEDEELKFEPYLIASNLSDEWNSWILDIADKGFTPSVLEDHSYWMNTFGKIFPQYNNPLTTGLQTPQATMNILDLCNY